MSWRTWSEFVCWAVQFDLGQVELKEPPPYVSIPLSAFSKEHLPAFVVGRPKVIV